MKIKCPVAGCDYTVRGADDGFKHFQNYDEFHKTLHWNWLKYYYKDLVDSDMLNTVKFRVAYRRWHENEKKLKMQMHKKKGKAGQDTSGNISIKNGKVTYNDEEYTMEQFQNMMKGIKYVPVEIKK